MIPINRFHDLLEALQAHVNAELSPGNWTLKDGLWIDDGHFDDDAEWTDLPTPGKMIDHIIESVTEAQAQKKIADKKGIVLVSKMAPADSDIQSIDDYSENNHCLIFILEKVEPGKVKDATEREHYAKMQDLMSLVKEWFLNHGLNSSENDGIETLGKPFRTEWEYQIYGNFNGLSIGFDLKDFSL